jgi:hypothetical protein
MKVGRTPCGFDISRLLPMSLVCYVNYVDGLYPPPGRPQLAVGSSALYDSLCPNCDITIMKELRDL